MARGDITDYAGEAVYAGDLINYPSRQDNGVRASDAVVLETYFSRVGGRKFPMLKVQPTGTDSGHTPRVTMRAEHVAATHVRLLRSGFANVQEG